MTDAELKAVREAMEVCVCPTVAEGTAMLAEILRLRDNLREAVSTFRAIATPPTKLNPGYDHYAACRDVARMAILSFEHVLTDHR